MKKAKTLLMIALAACMAPMIGCEKEEGPLEEAGEKVDEAAEDVRDAAKDATD